MCARLSVTIFCFRYKGESTCRKKFTLIAKVKYLYIIYVQKGQEYCLSKKNIVVDKHRGIATRDRIHRANSTKGKEKSIFFGCTCVKRLEKKILTTIFTRICLCRLVSSVIQMLYVYFPLYKEKRYIHRNTHTHILTPLQTPRY